MARGRNLTSGSSSTDAASYTTAAVTLTAGRAYLLSVANSKAASPDAVSTVTGGPTWTSRSSVSFNTVGSPTQRVSVWSGVPTSDYRGTVVIAFGGTETGCAWSLDEYTEVDTGTDDGVIQVATGTTASATTVAATLVALGSTLNPTHAATALGSTAGVTPGTGFAELSDVAVATPAARLQAQYQAGAGTVAIDQSWSGATAAAIIAVELKADVMALCSLADAKYRLGITDTSEDANLARYIVHVSAWVMAVTARQFARTPGTGTRTYLFDIDQQTRELRIPKGIAEASLLETATSTGGAFSTVTSSSWFLDPAPADRDYGWPATSISLSDVTGTCFYPGKRVVRVTMALGFEAVPDDIAEVALNLTVALHRRRGASSGGDTVTVDVGGNRTYEWALTKKDKDTLARYTHTQQLVG